MPAFQFTFGDITYDLNSRTHLMGILNVTPDSFSDGGSFFTVEDAVRRGIEIAEEGADFIDVGGESTRPGSESISVEEELRRVTPVIEQLAKRVRIPISIDTYKSQVADKALSAGAIIVNDITGFHADRTMPDIIGRHHASAIVMHTKGMPKSMQENPRYENVIEEIKTYLRESIDLAKRAGINQIIVDPGLGFGKTVEHNLEILRELRSFHQLGCPVLIGPSRKSFIGKILDLPVDERLEGTAAAAAISIMNGANIIRVHDVKKMKRVALIVDAVINLKHSEVEQ